MKIFDFFLHNFLQNASKMKLYRFLIYSRSFNIFINDIFDIYKLICRFIIHMIRYNEKNV